MTKYGPASTFLLVGGKDISGDTFQLSDSVEEILAQSDGFGLSWEAHLGVGKAKTTLEASGGFYDDRTAGLNEALQAKSGAPQLTAYGMAGYAVGADVTMLEGSVIAHWKRVLARDGLTMANADYVVSGSNRRGVVLHGLGQETADGNTQSTPADQSLAPRLPSVAITSSSVANPTVITAPAHGLITGDVIIISSHSGSTPTVNGERTVTVTGVDTFTIPVNVSVGGTGGTFVKATSTGCVIDLHVPALTLGGYTNVVATPIDSADASSWATLGSAFTAVTAAGASQRITVTGQVRRYTAVSWAFTGSGSNPVVIPYVSISR